MWRSFRFLLDICPNTRTPAAAVYTMDCSSIKLRPCLQESHACYDGESSTVSCWIVTFAQLFLALIFLSYPVIKKVMFCMTTGERKRYKSLRRGNSRKHCDGEEEDSSTTGRFTPSPILKRAGNKVETPSSILMQQRKDVCAKVHFQPEETGERFEDPPPDASDSSVTCRYTENFLSDETDKRNDLNGSSEVGESLRNLILSQEATDSPVFRTNRSEENFLKQNDNETIQYPSDYESEYTTLHQNNGVTPSSVLKSVLSLEDARDMIRTSVGFAFLAATVSSFYAILFSYGEYIQEHCGDRDDVLIHAHRRQWVESGANALQETIDSFKFLPIFLLLAAFAFLVDRWRRFMVTCHVIQGRLNDIGLLCGTLPDSSPLKESSQRKLYTIYRYLNGVHILCLKSFSPSLRHFNGDISLFAMTLNLLTEEEVRIVSAMENKARDGMISLLSHAIDDLMLETDKEHILIPKGVVLSSKVCGLRAKCAKLHDLFVRDNPNEYTVSIGMFVNCFKILVVLSSPLCYFQRSSSGYLACFQPGVLIGVFSHCCPSHSPECFSKRYRTLLQRMVVQ